MNQYAGTTKLDDFTTYPVDTGVKEAFDTTATGEVPKGWQTWGSGAAGSFAVSSSLALSPANGLASTGGSTTIGRAWSTADLPADVDASAAVYLNNLIPAQVFVRGSNLDTATPTYYAATITRGMTVKLTRVVDGVATDLGSLTSKDYTSSQWLRVHLTAEGDHLLVTIFRPGTGQWLSADGTWSDSPEFALDVHDGAIAAAGSAGLARGAAYSGTVVFDDFDAHPASQDVGPVVNVAPTSGTSPFSGDVSFLATATGNPTRLEFRLNGVLRAVSPSSPALWTLDTTTLTNGTYTLNVRAFDAAGNMGSADYTFTTDNADSGPIFTPDIPRHYSHIRIAELAYSGNPMGTFEKALLRSSVDLVIPNTQYLGTIDAQSPNTPQLIYSNVSNLYQGLLTDWLSYADAHGVSRELAFYHVTKATAFTGASPSSQPVNWFWGTFQTTPDGTTTDVTSAARGGRNVNVNFGASGTTTAIGYTDKFREMNVTLVTGAASGWSGVWEYATAVDSAGKPTAWKKLTLTSDGTQGLTQSGQITFDPPTDWVPSAIGAERLYYVRFRVTSGTSDQAPELKTVFGRDYVGVSALNIIVQPGVTGQVTAEMENVPWDQALEQVLRINKLGY
ncbi:MAG TPA: Ig-like domain-containing protein, partial [Gemmata sp.]|nr:Ig-like domain-containing protein [Gemmata sp.]